MCTRTTTANENVDGQVNTGELNRERETTIPWVTNPGQLDNTAGGNANEACHIVVHPARPSPNCNLQGSELDSR